MKRMKKMVLLLMITVSVVLVQGCGNDDRDRNSRETAEATVTPDNLKNDAETPDVSGTPDATGTPEPDATDIPNTTPTPGTAEKPAALHVKDVAHATGVKETYSDPSTGKTYDVLEDSGEDGHTKTMNCFDDAGNLMWWESFKYGSDLRVSEIIRREPVNNDLLCRKVLYYNGNNLETMVLYEAVPGGTDGVEEQKTLMETYFPGGSLHAKTIYYPYQEVKRYTPQEKYEYDENGTETYHAFYSVSGDVDVEYINGEKFFPVPDNVTGMFAMLNEANNEDFEVVWKSCQKKIAENSLTEQWETVCEVFNGYYDLYGTALYRLRNEYGLKVFAAGSQGIPSSTSLSSAKKNEFYNRDITAAYKSILKIIEDDQVNPQLLAKVYRAECYPELGGTIWLSSEYKEATKSLKKAKRNDADMIRILIVDYSKAIWGDTISRELLLEDVKYSERMVERAETILKGLFLSVSDKVCFTSYPELADVVFEIHTEYPFAGKYSYTNGTIAEVWNMSMNVKAVNMRGKGEISVTFENKAGNKVTTKGGTKIYMRVPDVTEEEYRDKAENFTNTVLSWFAE